MKLRKFEVAINIFKEQFGEIHNPAGDRNCGYSPFYKLGICKEEPARQELPKLSQNPSTAKKKRK